MRKTIIALLFIVVSQSVMAQIDTADIRKRILAESTRSELIQKCRSRIVNAIECGDRDLATELMFYAKTTFDDDNYQTFTPDEFWNLAIWLRKYKLATSEMALFDSISAAQFNGHKNTLGADFLYVLLRDFICSDSLFFDNDISSDTSLTSCERDFLLLYVKNLKHLPTYRVFDGTLFNESDFFNPDTLNVRSNEFLLQYPGSQFEPFVRNFLRYEYKKSGLMYGGAAYFGAILVGGDAHDKISGGFGVGIDLNLSYKGIVTGAQLSISSGHKSRDEFHGTDGAIYDYGVKFDGVSPNFYIGYWFLYRGISVLPAIGYGGFRLEVDSSEGNENLKGCYVKSDWGPVLSVEIGYGNKIFAPTETYASNLQMAWGVRYVYQPVDFNIRNGDISGETHRITLIYRVAACKLKRIFE